MWNFLWDHLFQDYCSQSRDFLCTTFQWHSKLHLFNRSITWVTVICEIFVSVKMNWTVPFKDSSMFIAKLSPWFGLFDGSVFRKQPPYWFTSLSAWSWASLQSVGLFNGLLKSFIEYESYNMNQMEYSDKLGQNIRINNRTWVQVQECLDVSICIRYACQDLLYKHTNIQNWKLWNRLPLQSAAAIPFNKFS